MSENPAGAFPACFIVSRELSGGVTLTLKWLVDSLNKTVSGSGHIFQSVSPPTDNTLEMTGHFHVADGKVRILASGARPGASIQVAMELDGWGGPGTADLKWLANNHFFEDSGVPVKSTDCFA